jgi:hypothetical protein
MQQNCDVIAVRKRTTTSYHQDLSREDFYNAISSLVNGYKRKVAYGSSLGAYCAIYYGSRIENCQILSLAPRNSAHPYYGLKLKEKVLFRHSLTQPYSPHLSPIISYDPKDQIDNTYVKGDVIDAFPNAHYIECPYAGHTTIRYFLEMGVLKDLVISVIHGHEVPTIHKHLRSRSPQFLVGLGNACLERNKVNTKPNKLFRMTFF